MSKQIVTPKAKCKWASIVKPNTTFNPDGDWTITLVYTKEEIAPIVKSLQEMIQQKKEEEEKNTKKKLKISSDSPWKPELDQNENETGNWELKFKQKAVVVNKKGERINIKIGLFDSKGKAIPEPNFLVGNGSTVKVAYTPFTYVMKGAVGVSLRLSMVQILDLIEYGNDSPFGEEEGTFSTEKDDMPFTSEEAEDDIDF